MWRLGRCHGLVSGQKFILISYLIFLIRDIHQDNGELLDVVNKIHNAVPASCANLSNGSSPLAINDPEFLNEDIPESDVNEEPIRTPVSSAPAAPANSVWSGDAEDEDIYYDDEEEYNTAIAPFTPTSVTPASTTLIKPTYSPSVQADPAIGSVTAIHGGPCSNSGQQMCVESGKTGQWLTCNFEKWLARDCAAGLVCYDGNNGKKQKRMYDIKLTIIN
jgi:hypothetical protein